MSEIRRADPALRRQVLLGLLLALLVGAGLIAGFERHRIPIHDWLLSELAAPAQGVPVAFVLLVVILVTPLLALAGGLWALGRRIMRAREFPPPGMRVVRDTPVITGAAAATRGWILKAFALFFAIASLVSGFLLWRLVSLLSRHAA